MPDLRFIADYHAEPRYIEALARSVEAHWQRPRPRRSVSCCRSTAFRSAISAPAIRISANARRPRAACANGLILREDEVVVTFQSRVGREPWLAPYTDQVLQAMPRQGITHVQVLCPGFAVDCLETLEEIAI